MKQFIHTNGKDIISVATNAAGELLLNGLGELDALVEKTGATYEISYRSYKLGTIHFPNGKTENWGFAK